MVYVAGIFHLASENKYRTLNSKSMKNPDSNSVIKVAIADDHALFRTGVKTSLSSRKDIQMVAEAENGMQLLNLLRHIQPDVVLLDIQMPIMDGLATLPEIKKLYPGVKVIMLSMHNDHSVISKMMEIGANSYLTKESGSEMIYDAIRTVYEQDFFFNECTIGEFGFLPDQNVSYADGQTCFYAYGIGDSEKDFRIGFITYVKYVVFFIVKHFLF